jgi:hypothetical protein
VVISNRRKGQSLGPPAKPPGISALKVNPNRRILVVRDEPTTERIDVTKTIERINKRIEAANKPFRRVAIYGRKGGDMTLNLNSYSTNLTMWKYKSVVEAGLMDSWLFGFDPLQDWERIRDFMAGMPLQPERDN